MPELQVLMSGIAFGESPRWHDRRPWFSDWGAQQVVAVDLERIRGAEYRELAHTPHMPTLEQPGLVAQALDRFLPAEAREIE